jgi:hypothetical protein
VYPTGAVAALTLDEYFEALQTYDLLPFADPNLAESCACLVRTRLQKS